MKTAPKKIFPHLQNLTHEQAEITLKRFYDVEKKRRLTDLQEDIDKLVLTDERVTDNNPDALLKTLGLSFELLKMYAELLAKAQAIRHVMNYDNDFSAEKNSRSHLRVIK